MAKDIDKSSHSAMSTTDKIAQCRRHLASSPELWQSALLDPSQFSSLLRERDIHGINPEHIEKLWHIGLLRADLVLSRREIKVPSLQLIENDVDGYVYFDVRMVKRRAAGFGGSFPKRKMRRDIRLFFHPFRLYAIYYLSNILTQRIFPAQYLLYPDGYENLARNHTRLLNRMTAREDFSGKLNAWNETAEASIIFEPIFHIKVFSRLSFRAPETLESITEKRDKYRDHVMSTFAPSDTDSLEKLRRDLIINAEAIDRNKLLHVLLRLTKWHSRQDMKGTIGSCMAFSAMAELIRRANEEILKEELPEEDEIGFGEWMPGAREAIYGTKRIFDERGIVLRNLLTQIGIDYGVKVRCYIEGDTEYGALQEAVGDLGSVQLINVRGQFVERGGRGLQFERSLRQDTAAQIFSFIMLDNDRSDYARVARIAAERDLFTGCIFSSSPDIEFQNFSVEELCLVVLNLAEEIGVHDISVSDIVERTINAKSGKQFFEIIIKEFPQISSIRQGEAWGKALIAYAWRNRERADGEKRQVIKAVEMIIRATGLTYNLNRQRYKVDPCTGELIERDAS